MEYFHDDYVDDAFKEALKALKAEVSRERVNAVELIASWAGVRPSTMYEWMEKEHSRPSSYRFVWRLLVNSTRHGFTSFAEAATAPTVSVALRQEVTTNGRLDDEHRQATVLWGQILQAEEAGNWRVVLRLSDDLQRVNITVNEEALRQMVQ